MDFRFSAEESAFRDEVREFILAEIPAEIRWQDRTTYNDDLWPIGAGGAQEGGAEGLGDHALAH